MSTRADQFVLADNPYFQNRVLAAGMAYSIATVVGEVGTTPNHTDRLALTQQVFLYPNNWKYRLALACVMANANLQNAAPAETTAADADIAIAVAAVWTQMGLANTASQSWKIT